MSQLNLPFQLVAYNNALATNNQTATVNGIPMNFVCDTTGQYVAYSSVVRNTTTQPYYYGGTYYSTNYGKTFTKLVNPTFSGLSFPSMTPVSLSVMSQNYNGKQYAYLIQSFTYNAIDGSFNVPNSFLYYCGLNSNSTPTTIFTPIYLNSGLSNTSYTSTENLKNVIFTSIINNNTSVNGQSFLFLVTNSYQDINYKQSLPNYQWLCQFNPIYGNNATGYIYNTYLTIYSPGAALPFVINYTLAVNQSTITITPALTSSSSNSIYGIVYDSKSNELKNSLFVSNNKTNPNTPIQSTPIQTTTGVFYFLNIQDNQTNYITYDILPKSTTYPNDNIQMWNVTCDNNTLFLCNNVNYNADLSLNLATSSILYTYNLSTLGSSSSPFTYQLSDPCGNVINGNVCVSPIYNSGNSVYLSSSLTNSGLFYDLSYNSFDSITNFKSLPFDLSYNYWLNTCTNYYGNRYYLTSCNANSTAGYIYSLYNTFDTNFTTYSNASSGYNVYPSNNNFSTSVNETFKNFKLTNGFHYLNCLVVGPGGNGTYGTSGASSTFLAGGGGGTAQAVNIPYFASDSSGNVYQIISMQIYVNSDKSYITYTYQSFNPDGSPSNTYTLSINGNVGGDSTSTAGGSGGSASVTNNISFIYNTSNNTVTSTGASAVDTGKNGQIATNNTKTTSNGTVISATGGTSGSGYTNFTYYPSPSNTLYVSNTTIGSGTTLYNTKTKFSYISAGGDVTKVTSSDYTADYAQNGGGGAGYYVGNSNIVPKSYSNGAYGFVLVWLTP